MELDISGNSKFLFHVGADILNSLFLGDLFIFFHVYKDLIQQHIYHFSLSLFYLED